MCSKHLELAIRAKPNGRYIKVAILQRAGIAKVYCNELTSNLLVNVNRGVFRDVLIEQ